MRRFLLFLTFMPALAVHAQFTLPESDLWLLSLDPSSAGRPEPQRLTDRPGYNNQPFYSADGRFIYYTRGGGPGTPGEGYTDLARLEPASGGDELLAETPLSEFSPRPIPGQAALAAVQVQADGAQWLVRFAPETGCFTRIGSADNVGYHAWLDSGRVALLLVDEPNRLVLFDLERDQTLPIAAPAGRSLSAIRPLDALLLVAVAPEARRIEIWDPLTHQRSALISLPERSEDFSRAPNGDLWTASGSKLYRWRPGRDPNWFLAAELAPFGIAGITRLAIRPDGRALVLVAAEP